MKTCERFGLFHSSHCLLYIVGSLLLMGQTGLAAVSVLFTQDTVISVLDTNYDGAEITVSNCTVTVAGAHTFARVHLRGGGSLTQMHDGTEPPLGLNLLIAGDMLIAAGCRVDVSGRGYPAGVGPGAGKASVYGVGGSGGGYGGYGGAGGTNTGIVNVGLVYGSVATPAQFGSGGGRGYWGTDLGGSGGGVVKLEVGGLLLIDGTIAANGNPGIHRASGGGAGGSIWLAAQTIAGSGVISANGGGGEPGSGGGGGGGRVAIYCTHRSFNGSVVAHGGAGHGSGGPGTIYWRSGASAAEEVLIENGGVPGHTALLPEGTSFSLELAGGAIASLFGDMALRGLLIGSNSWLLASNRTLQVVGDAVIDNGGGINADCAGYGVNQGTGAGKVYSFSGVYFGGGGGYGGGGGDGGADTYSAGGVAYGSLTMPRELGSGGGSNLSPGPESARGGGAVRLEVSGHLQVNGRISANGGDGFSTGSGGAAGGSVWLTAGTLSGAGIIAANGGRGNGFGPYAGGGGGGGRISIGYGLNLFFGEITARGGSGYQWGGAGTIYTKANNQPYGQVLVDNGGPQGANTTWSGAGPVDLVVRGGGVIPAVTAQTFNNLEVGLGGRMLVTNEMITVSGNVRIAAGGSIVADGAGYFGTSGPGAGRYDSRVQAGSGGGYGGFGAAVPGSTVAVGGVAYGSATSPNERGSGGGGYSSYGGGGAGGGNLRMNISGTLMLDGIISANGAPGMGPGAGGGSGGTVSLTVGAIAGSGAIAAKGGASDGFGGGGGGGRVAISFYTNLFNGSVVAWGGPGAARGGAGTIYLKARNQSSGYLLVDNGGVPGAFTAASAYDYGVDLVVSGGGAWVPTSQQSLKSVVIGSNSCVILSNSYQSLTATSLVVQRGGAVWAEGLGSLTPGLGAGGYVSWQNGYIGGGGGYGGYGGSVTNAKLRGGIAFGSVENPTDTGGRGGYYYSAGGGAGGGAIRLTVTDLLQVEGRISANGVCGTNSGAGGGAGGSILLNVGTLAGSGVISADGGAGLGLGGGGGGGRISIQYGVNAFSGAMSACGGTGGEGATGGAGTIHLKAKSQAGGAMLLVDNGGRLGTNTPLTGLSGGGLVIQGGAVAQQMVALSLSSLLVASNGWLLATNQALSFSGNATILPGGGILADGRGYAGSQGPGAAYPYSTYGYGYTGGGAGYGGYGAAGAGGGSANGGNSYGSIVAPVDPGSGGAGTTSAQYGGSGGGTIRLNVVGILSVGGRVSANGTEGLAPGAGGGSGGSIWITAGSLTGSGIIAADGGRGNGWGGGGGGGRIALELGQNAFSGQVSAAGGQGGSGAGGAGTIYTRPANRSGGQVLVDNRGQIGTNTPIPYLTTPLDLTVRGGAVAWPYGNSLLLSNLTVGVDGTLVWRDGYGSTALTVLNDVVVESGGWITADGKGYPASSGPGAGLTAGYGSVGSGAGHGGVGGASSQLPGGGTYGSLEQPLTMGSGGGCGGSGSGSQGGGAILISAGRGLTVNGTISANGNAGLVEDSGGGSGGSVWLSAAWVSGVGRISAEGGAGQLYGGGGGGGGRIAIYSPANVFGGITSVRGGDGFARGGDGTIYLSSSYAPLEVVSQWPTGTVSYLVSQVDLTFNMAVDPYSAAAAEVALMTPGGLVVGSNCTVEVTGSRGVRIAVPAQSAEGDYTVVFGPQLKDLYQNPMAQAHTGHFTIVWPQIHGRVADTNNQPVAGVLVEANNGLTSALTDTNGEYALKAPVGVSVTVVPSKSGLFFIPGAYYPGTVQGEIWDYNFQAQSSELLGMDCAPQETGLAVSWYGVAGAAYQALWSSNLVDWVPYGLPVMGTNGPARLLLPFQPGPVGFYRLQVGP